jgi:hypothetical protein
MRAPRELSCPRDELSCSLVLVLACGGEGSSRHPLRRFGIAEFGSLDEAIDRGLRRIVRRGELANSRPETREVERASTSRGD